MIAPVVHGSVRPATRPPEGLRPIVKQLYLITSKLCLKFTTKVVRFVCETIPPSRLFGLTGPGDEFEFALVEMSVLAFPMLIVPHPSRYCRCRGRGWDGGTLRTGFFVGFPVGGLTCSSWMESTSNRRVGYRSKSRMRLLIIIIMRFQLRFVDGVERYNVPQ